VAYLTLKDEPIPFVNNVILYVYKLSPPRHFEHLLALIPFLNMHA